MSIVKAKISQARFKFIGATAATEGREISGVASKTNLGTLDVNEIIPFDLKTKYAFHSFNGNKKFRCFPVSFQFEEGFEYSIEEISYLSINYGFDAWIGDSNSNNAYLITAGDGEWILIQGFWDDTGDYEDDAEWID